MVGRARTWRQEPRLPFGECQRAGTDPGRLSPPVAGAPGRVHQVAGWSGL